MANIHLRFTLFSAFYSPLTATMTGNFPSGNAFYHEAKSADRTAQTSQAKLAIGNTGVQITPKHHGEFQ